MNRHIVRKKRERSRFFSPSLHHAAIADGGEMCALRFSGGDVANWQRRLRTRLKKLLGDDPESRVPLNVRRLWLRKHPLGTIEKIVFASELRCDVAAYVCLPKQTEGLRPFVICLQGHVGRLQYSIGMSEDDERKKISVPGDLDFAIGCMERGLSALCIEQRSFGERREQAMEKPSGDGCQDAAMHALFLGRTLMGERVYDVDRAIDYLMARKDADPRRIGVMGNSTGGMVALFAAATLSRIRFAMPSSCFSSFRDSVLAMGHCSCNYVPGLLKTADLADIAGLVAPRPLVLVHGREDHLFPIRSARRAFRELKAIYEAAGARQSCSLVEGPEGHRFYAARAWPVLLRMLQNS
jgi:dienelactone hydrolase